MSMSSPSTNRLSNRSASTAAGREPADQLQPTLAAAIEAVLVDENGTGDVLEAPGHRRPAVDIGQQILAVRQP
jgi:hypothetical protein